MVGAGRLSGTPAWPGIDAGHIGARELADKR
jgi:hypothetical protein